MSLNTIRSVGTDITQVTELEDNYFLMLNGTSTTYGTDREVVADKDTIATAIDDTFLHKYDGATSGSSYTVSYAVTYYTSASLTVTYSSYNILRATGTISLPNSTTNIIWKKVIHIASDYCTLTVGSMWDFNLGSTTTLTSGAVLTAIWCGLYGYYIIR